MLAVLCKHYTYGSEHRKDVQYFFTVQVLVVGDKVINEGEWISLNGSTGEVILGKQPLSPPAVTGDLEIFMSWADKLRRIKVHRHL